MKGLLRKEFYALKNTFGILAVFMLVYAAIGYGGNNASMLVAMAAMIVMMQQANSISYDELYHWDRYVLTMPVSRKMVVQSKYVLSFLLCCFMLLVGTVFTLLLGGSFVDAFVSTLCVAAIALIISALALPCMFKWGAQRGRLILIFICGATGAAGAMLAILLMKFGNLSGSVGGLMPGEGQHSGALTAGMLTAGLLLLTAIVTAISYRIACGIYEKKEF